MYYWIENIFSVYLPLCLFKNSLWDASEALNYNIDCDMQYSISNK